MPAHRKDSKPTPKPTFWTAKVCPFAQTVEFALRLKDVDYEHAEVDLKNKPDRLLELNEKGLVPVLEDGKAVIYESGICVEYIDDVWEGGVSLLPNDAFDRAKARMLCDGIRKNFIPNFFKLLLCQNKEQQETARADLLKALSQVTQSMCVSPPYVFGDHISMVDITLAPFVERFYILEYYRSFQVPKSDEFERFHVWWKAVDSHPCFIPTKLDMDYMIERYKSYADNTATSQVAKSINTGKVIP